MLFDVAGNSVPVGDSENVVCTYQTAIQYATGLSITPSTNQEITEGDTLTLSGTLSPNDINNKKITWSTNDKTVASFAGNASATTVTGANLTLSSHKPGTVTIKATPEDGSSSYAKQISVKVKSKITQITLDKDISQILVNATTKLTATTTPEDVIANSIVWTSSDSNIAEIISTNGKEATIKGKKRGVVTITASAYGNSSIKDTCTVTVGALVTQISTSNYGEYVNYGIETHSTGKTLKDGSTAKSNWRIFYTDGTYVYITTSYYLPTSQVPNNVFNVKDSYYRGYWSANANEIPSATPTVAYKDNFLYSYMLSNMSSSYSNYKASSTLLDTTKWSGFVDGRYAIAAIGAPTVDMFVNSWNQKYPSQKIYIGHNQYGYSLGTSPNPLGNPDVSLAGYVGLTNSLYFINGSADNDCVGYHLSTPYGGDNLGTATWAVSYLHGGVGDLDALGVGESIHSARPVVMLKTTVTGTKDANGIWQLD